MTIKGDACYKIKQEVMTRNIEGELVVVPIVSGIGSLDAPMYSLNETGAAVWEKLDGRHSLNSIIDALALEFNAPIEEIRSDVLALLTEFERMDLIVEI